MRERQEGGGRAAQNKAEENGEQLKLLLLRSSTKAIRLLVKIMGDENVKPETRMACAGEILNRTYGKSGQVVAQTGAMTLELAEEARGYAE